MLNGVMSYDSEISIHILLALWVLPSLLCVYILVKLRKIKMLLSELTKNQLEVSSGTRALCYHIERLDADVDSLWKAVFSDDDPDDEEDLDEEPSNVIAIGKRISK
jgi:hypothetical protein